jgi:riboflavin biosynthesis pyrimidine reductase
MPGLHQCQPLLVLLDEVHDVPRHVRLAQTSEPTDTILFVGQQRQLKLLVLVVVATHSQSNDETIGTIKIYFQ